MFDELNKDFKVRLNPYDPDNGAVSMRRKVSGHRFLAGVWHDVNTSDPGVVQLLTALARERQRVERPESLLAFTIVEPEEAKRIRNRELYGALEQSVTNADNRPQPPPQATLRVSADLNAPADVAPHMSRPPASPPPLPKDTPPPKTPKPPPPPSAKGGKAKTVAKAKPKK